MLGMFCGFYLCKIYPGIFREGKKAHPEEERFISKYIGKEQAWDNRMEGIKSTYSFPGLHLHPVYLFNLCSQLFSCLCVLPFTCVHVYICAWLNLRHKAGLFWSVVGQWGLCVCVHRGTWRLGGSVDRTQQQLYLLTRMQEVTASWCWLTGPRSEGKRNPWIVKFIGLNFA